MNKPETILWNVIVYKDDDSFQNNKRYHAACILLFLRLELLKLFPEVDSTLQTGWSARFGNIITLKLPVAHQRTQMRSRSGASQLLA